MGIIIAPLCQNSSRDALRDIGSTFFLKKHKGKQNGNFLNKEDTPKYCLSISALSLALAVETI